MCPAAPTRRPQIWHGEEFEDFELLPEAWKHEITIDAAELRALIGSWEGQERIEGIFGSQMQDDTIEKNYTKLELDDARVASAFIAAAGGMSKSAEIILSMGALNIQNLQHHIVDKTVDEKAAETLQQKDAAAQAEKKSKSNLREAENLIEELSAKQDNEPVKILEYADIMDKCNIGYADALALSLQAEELEAWVPIFQFDSRSHMQGKTFVCLDDVHKTDGMSMKPWCNSHSLYHHKHNAMLDFEDCLQSFMRCEAKTTEDTDTFADLASVFAALCLEDK